MKKNVSILIIYIVSSIYITTVYAQNNSAVFNGDNSYYSINPNQSINFSNNFTIEAWVNPRIKLGTFSILNKVNCATSKTAYALSIVDGHVQWSFNANGNCNNTSYIKTDEALIEAGICTHIAVVHSENGIEIYVNGQWVSNSLINGSYSDVDISSEPIRIGIYQNINSNLVMPFIGTIDEIRIWDTVRSENEIALNYNRIITETEPHLRAYYTFNPNSVNGNEISNNIDSEPLLKTNYIGTSNPTFESSCVIFDAGINQIEKESIDVDVTLHPNPVSNILNIDLTQINTISTITISDIIGNIVSSFIPDDSSIQFDFSNFQSGIYWMKFSDKNNNIVTKRVIKH